MYDGIIVGAGATGLFAAANLPDCFSCLILEKMHHVGIKLLMSGNGQANITHTGSINDFILHYGKQGNWLKPALSALSNEKLCTYFEEAGVPITVREDGKIFPASFSSKQILDCLLERIQAKGHEIITSCPVDSITYAEGQFEIQTSTKGYKAKNLLITTGGMTYPSTGSTGDGYEFAKKLTHSIIQTKPALGGIRLYDCPFYNLSGVTLPNATLTIWEQKRKIWSGNDSLLFTHEGISGLIVLHASRYFQLGQQITLSFVSHNEVTNTLEQWGNYLQARLKNTVLQVLKQLKIPDSLCRYLLAKAEIKPALKISEMTKIKQKELGKLVFEYPLRVTELPSKYEGMVTAGGVDLQEINRKTMESKKIAGLYFAGEVLDIDGDTGGYNLQAAFSTANLAVKNIQKDYGQNKRKES